MANTNSPIIIETSKSSGGVGDAVFKIAIVAGGYLLARKLYRDYKANKTEEAAGSDINVQQAIAIHQAIDGAGTAEEVLYEVAGQIKDWPAVDKAYRNKYQSSMLEDIKNDLSAEDYQRFMAIYNLNRVDPKTGAPVVSKNTVAKGYVVITEKETWLRKTPVYQKVVSKLIDPLGFNKTNAISLVGPNKIVGMATGRQANDLKANPPIRFIEVTAFAKSGKTIKSINVWVASSQVITSNKGIKDYPSSAVLVLTEAEYNKSLAGIGSPTQATTADHLEIITNAPLVKIYNDKLEFHDTVHRPGIILGNKLGVMEQDEKKFVGYMTVDGNVRYSQTEFVKEKQPVII